MEMLAVRDHSEIKRNTLLALQTNIIFKRVKSTSSSHVKLKHQKTTRKIIQK